MIRRRPCMTGLVAIAIAVMTIPTAGIASPSCGAASVADSLTIAQSLSRMRAQAGLGAVTADPALTAVAAGQACDMATRNRLSHQGGGGIKARTRAAGYSASVLAENIAAGQPDAGAAMNSWAGSAGHRSNMLNARVQHVGIGQALAADGQTRYWSLVLAAPR